MKTRIATTFQPACSHFSALRLGTLSLLLATLSAEAVNQYWDSNGTAVGAGATPTGTWGTSNFWNTASTGSGGTLKAATISTDTLFFCAGTDAVNPFTVNVPAAVVASAMTIQSSGALTLTSAVPATTITLGATASATVTLLRVNSGSSLTIGTNVTLVQNNSGSQMWINSTAPTAASGNITVENGGTLRCASGSTRAILIDGVGNVTTIKTGGLMTGNGNIQHTCGQSAGSSNTLVVAGGAVTQTSTGVNAGLCVGNQGTGVCYLTNGGTITIPSTATTIGLTLGQVAAANGTFHLDGGIVTCPHIRTLSTVNSVFNFNGGKLVANRAAFTMTGLTRANVRNGGAIIDDGGFAITIGQALEHSNIGGDAGTDGGLTKLGAGTLTLAGANTYNGGTKVSNGTLAVAGLVTGNAAVRTSATLSGSGSVSGSVMVDSGGAVTAGISGVGNLTLGSLTLGATGGDTQTVNVTLNNAVISVSGALMAIGSTTINVSSSGIIAPGTYPLISYTGTQLTSGFVLGIKPAGSSLSYGASSIDLVVTDSLMWTGANSGAWDNTTTNWQWIAAVAATKYVNDVALSFDDTGANTGITLNTAVSPGGMTFGNNSASYSLSGSGSIGGTYGLTMSGAGSLTIATTNSYSGNTTLSAGTVEVNADAALGSGGLTLGGGVLSNSVSSTLVNAVNLSTNTSVGVQTGSTLTLSGAVTSNGTLSKVGAGTLTLSGANTYSGATTVSNGTLTLSGPRTGSSGAITVGTDAELATLNLEQGGFSLGANTFTVSTGTAGVGTNSIVNQTGGNISFTGGNALLVGGVGITTSDINNIGVYNLSGGSITGFSSGTRGVILGVNAGCSGIFNLSGTGSLNLPTGALIIARRDSSANNTTGVFSQTGGSAVVNTLAMGSANANSGGKATLTLTGGTFSNNSFTALSAGISDTSAITIGGTADVTLSALPTTRGSGSTATITFDGGTLRPTAANANYISNMTAAYLTANGASFNVDGGKDITIAQALEDAPSQTGKLAKAGAGALTLSGVNNYSGATMVSNGTLRVNGALAGGAMVMTGATLAGSGTLSGAVTVESGGSLTAGDISGVGNLTLGSLTLGAAGGDTQTVTVKPGTSHIIVVGALANSGVTTINLTNAGLLAPGVHPLITYSGPTITTGFVLGPVSDGTLQYNAGSIDLFIPDAPKWSGAVSAFWDTTTTNWLLITAGTPTRYVDGDPAFFDDGLTANPDVILNTTVTPDGVTFTNDTATYSLSGTGSVAGTNGLTKSGAGLLILGNANTYSGGTTLLGTGVLAVTNGMALGTGPLTLKSAQTGASITVLLSGGITVTNSVVIDATAGREAIFSTNGNNTLSGGISITGAGGSAYYLNSSGGAGSVFAVSNAISGPTYTNAFSLRGLVDNRGLISGPITLPLCQRFQIIGDANWTIGSTGNSWTETRISSGVGGFVLGANDALATGAQVRWDADTSGALDLAGFNQTVAGLNGSTLTPTVGNSSTISDALLRLNGGNYTFAGQLVDKLGAGTRKLSVELLSGTQTLTGNNPYSGTTTISGGTLNIGNGGTTGSLSNTAAIVNNGTLVFNRSDVLVVTNEISGVGNLTLRGSAVARPLHSSALGSGTIAVSAGTAQADTAHVELTGGITLTNAMTFGSRAYPATFAPHYVNVSGDNVLAPPGDLPLVTGGNVICLQSDSGRLVLTKGVTTAASAPRWLALQGAGNGEVQGSLSASMALFKGGTGTWTMTGSSPMTNLVTVSEGTLVVNGSFASGDNDVTVTGGTLAGNGTIAGPVTIEAAGTLAPGTSVGTLTIHNDLALQGTALMEISRNGAVLSHDHVLGVNTLTYGGALIVTNVGSSPLQVGDSFQLFAATNYFDSLANIVYPSGYTFTNSLAVDGRIWVAAVNGGAAPSFESGGVNRLSDGSISLTATGDLGTAYRLWASTNVALTPIASTWTLLTSGTVTVSPFTVNDPGATNHPQRFYIFSSP